MNGYVMKKELIENVAKAIFRGHSGLSFPQKRDELSNSYAPKESQNRENRSQKVGGQESRIIKIKSS
jgi:hypothetical protein